MVQNKEGLQAGGLGRMSGAELMGSLKLGNVWDFVQLIHRPTRTKSQLYKNPNIDSLETSISSDHYGTRLRFGYDRMSGEKPPK